MWGVLGLVWWFDCIAGCCQGCSQEGSMLLMPLTLDFLTVVVQNRTTVTRTYVMRVPRIGCDDTCIHKLDAKFLDSIFF